MKAQNILYIIYGLFKDAVGFSEYVASSERIINE
jgi:hypothetical protein